MPFIRNLLTQIGLAERRRDQRTDANGLTASCSTGSEQKKVRIGNISPTGLYLVTEERWQVGTTVVLTLGEKSSFEDSSRSQVKLWTRCVRVDEGGAGLAFTHSHINREKWLEAMSRAPSLVAENHPVQVFRFTRALSFLFHISPASEVEILKLISGILTRERTERVIEIALLVDDRLESQSRASRMNLPPGLLLRILSLAIEVEEAEIRELWARLLAAFSLYDSQDELNLAHVRLLSKLNLLHLRILSAAWLRANQAGLKSGPASPNGDFCTVKEIEAIAGIALVERIEWIVNDLHELGLLGGTTKPALCGRLAEVDLSLTDLGLKFCERSFGQSRPVQNEGQDVALSEQYVQMDSDDAMSASSRQGLSNSLASEAETIRQSSSAAHID
jgi:PilZ domain